MSSQIKSLVDTETILASKERHEVLWYRRDIRKRSASDVCSCWSVPSLNGEIILKGMQITLSRQLKRQLELSTKMWSLEGWQQSSNVPPHPSAHPYLPPAFYTKKRDFQVLISRQLINNTKYYFYIHICIFISIKCVKQIIV